jgi:hypothetical protein
MEEEGEAQDDPESSIKVSFFHKADSGSPLVLAKSEIQGRGKLIILAIFQEETRTLKLWNHG